MPRGSISGKELERILRDPKKSQKQVADALMRNREMLDLLAFAEVFDNAKNRSSRPQHNDRKRTKKHKAA